MGDNNVVDEVRNPVPRRSRNWVFTLNNPPAPYGALIFGDQCAFACYQLERGEQGTLHYQGVVVFKNARTLRGVRRILEGAHLEIMRGTLTQAVAYATKDDTREPGENSGPWRVGEQPAGVGQGRGTRTDLIQVQQLIKDGKSEKEIADEHFGTWCRHYRAFERYRRLTVDQRAWQTTCLVLWGPPGSGKSRYALEHGGASQFWVSRPRDRNGAVWWDGYEGQETVVIDEFYGWIPRDLTQRLVDRYPLLVETKGGACQFLARRIIITSNQPPSMWWPRIGLGAMQRRLDDPIGEVRFVGFTPDDVFEEVRYRDSLAQGGNINLDGQLNAMRRRRQ